MGEEFPKAEIIVCLRSFHRSSHVSDWNHQAGRRYERSKTLGPRPTQRLIHIRETLMRSYRSMVTHST